MTKKLDESSLATTVGDFVGSQLFGMQNGEFDLGVLSGNFFKSAEEKRNMGVTPVADLAGLARKRQATPSPAM